jgi:predicted Fe-S protein YdhL (DUF1289 family)
MFFSWFRRKPTVAPATPAAPEAPEAPPVDSGCTGVCQLDMASQLCKGCMRTISEIGGWRHMTDVQKQAVNSAALARQASTA